MASITARRTTGGRCWRSPTSPAASGRSGPARRRPARRRQVDEASRIELLLGGHPGRVCQEEGEQGRASGRNPVRRLGRGPGRHRRPPMGGDGTVRQAAHPEQARPAAQATGDCAGVHRAEDGPGSGICLEGVHRGLRSLFSPLGGSQPCTRAQCDEKGTSDLSQPCTSESGCTVEKCEKSNNDGPVTGARFKRGKWAKRRRLLAATAPSRASRRPSSGGSPAGTRTRPPTSYHATGDVDRPALDAELRRILAEREAVFPEFIEVEFNRIMTAVFGS